MFCNKLHIGKGHITVGCDYVAVCVVTVSLYVITQVELTVILLVTGNEVVNIRPFESWLRRSF